MTIVDSSQEKRQLKSSIKANIKTLNASFSKLLVKVKKIQECYVKKGRTIIVQFSGPNGPIWLVKIL